MAGIAGRRPRPGADPHSADLDAERVRRAQQASGIFTFEIGPERVARCDDGLRSLFGLPPGRRFDYETWSACLHPNDRARLQDDFARVLNHGGTTALEYRVRWPDGTVRWLMSRAERSMDRQGTACSIFGITMDITERKVVEERLGESRKELAASEARLRMALESTTDSVLTLNSEWRFTFLNRHALAQIDRGRELLGRIIWDVFPEVPGGALWDACQQCMTSRQVTEAEQFYDSLGLHFALRVFPAEDGGITVFFRDVTEARRTERALAESEARFRAAVQAVSGIVWTNNAHGQMEGEQPGWAALTGQAYNEYQGQGWSKAVHPEDAQPTIDAWNRAVVRRQAFVFEHRVRRHDGAWRYFAIRAIPLLQADGTVRQWVGVHIDVTDQREAETVLARGHAELERLIQERTADLQQTQARLAQAEKMSALGQLASGIAHDFNNVMQTVQGAANLIRRRPGDPAAIDRFAAMIEEAAQRGTSVTGRLLAFARHSEVQGSPVDVAALLDGLREVLVHTLGAGVAIRVELAPSLPPVLADRGQLETVLVNLATNARDAMPEGGTLTLAATAESVLAEASKEGLAPGSYVRFAIADTGAGMDAETLSRVTEPFFTTKPSGLGTGLGLPMARGFAEQSGGALALASEPGRGTVVTLWLPQAQAAGAADTSPRAPLETAAASGAPRILLVDDEDMVREVLAAQLADRGYDVVQASEGAAALELLDAGEAVDIVVSDLAMPGMDGIALIRAVQTRRARLPAILLTGYDGESALSIGGEEPSFPVSALCKPVRGAQLAAQVASLLESAVSH